MGPTHSAVLAIFGTPKNFDGNRQRPDLLFEAFDSGSPLRKQSGFLEAVPSAAPGKDGYE